MGQIDLIRLRATLGAPEFDRVVTLLRRRLELGRQLTGTTTLRAASHEERVAIDAFFGRKATKGDALLVNLDVLAESLRDAGICGDLETAVEALTGPVANRRALESKQTEKWDIVWRSLREGLQMYPTLSRWIDEVEGSGLLRRLCGGDADTATLVCQDLERVLKSVPVRAEPLAIFSARLFGDSHALDPGNPRSTLAIRAVARLSRVDFQDDAEGRRAAWAGVGVMCHELSTPALVFNLPSSRDTPLGRLLRTARNDIEPVHLSLRLLLRWPLSDEAEMMGREVFVCENPTVVALAAAQVGDRCAPIICVNGQFATPSLVLLRQLRDAGARLRYHGDFDPSGLAIARRAISESGAIPWRFNASDYVAAPKGVRFKGKPGATPWDPKLSEVMRTEQKSVHEEAVVDVLIGDLEKR